MNFHNSASLFAIASVLSSTAWAGLTDIVDGDSVYATVTSSTRAGALKTRVKVDAPISYNGNATMFLIDVTDKEAGVGSTTDPSAVIQDFVMFCFDLYDGAVSTTFDVYGESLTTLSHQPDSMLQGTDASVAGYIPAVERLFEMFYKGSAAGDWATGTSDENKRDAAAFQIAVWEMTYDAPVAGSWDVSAGNFRTSEILGDTLANDARSTAQSYLDSITADPTLVNSGGLIALIDEDRQNMIGYIAVPEPSLLGLQALALAALILPRRRRSVRK